MLGYVALGWRNREIALALGLREQTIKNKLWETMRKLGAADRTQAVVIAMERGWLPIGAKSA
ncbi:MAG: LuxR C-terminal-related transcriptional regulator [Actinomycetota bacterium]|nr:LuxR C-terminal-related transcriptional regulator [Actinomycetota bacterium]